MLTQSGNANSVASNIYDARSSSSCGNNASVDKNLSMLPQTS